MKIHVPRYKVAHDAEHASLLQPEGAGKLRSGPILRKLRETVSPKSVH